MAGYQTVLPDKKLLQAELRQFYQLLAPDDEEESPASKVRIPRRKDGLEMITGPAGQIASPEFRQEGGQFIQTLSLPAPQVSQKYKILKFWDLQMLAAAIWIKDREYFRKARLEPLLKAGWLERTIPDKPTSRLQKYRLTDKGRRLARQLRTDRRRKMVASLQPNGMTNLNERT